MRTYITLLFLSMSIIAVGQNPANEKKVNIDIPTLKNGTSDFFYLLEQQNADQLKLEKLYEGFDSLQIRIWYRYSDSDLRKLLILKRTNKSWSLDGYTLRVNWDDKSGKETLKSKSVEKLYPSSGFKNFLDSLKYLDITTLIHMQNIPGFSSIIADGKAVHVEVGTPSTYRFYGYLTPERFKNQYCQASKMVKILEFIEKELGPKWKF